MSGNATAIDDLPAVEAGLNYLAPSDEKPRIYAYDPPPDIPKSTVQTEPHRLPIHDLRPIQDSVSLDHEGFRLMQHTSAAHDFYDEVIFSAAHRWFYAPEMRADEAPLMKCYDSDQRARFVPHTAFIDPTTPVDAPPCASNSGRWCFTHHEDPPK